MPDLRKETINILDGKLLTPHFRPIVSLNQKKVPGYEALIRDPSDSALHSPFNFITAEQCNLNTRLEFFCREITIQSYADPGY